MSVCMCVLMPKATLGGIPQEFLILFAHRASHWPLTQGLGYTGWSTDLLFSASLHCNYKDESSILHTMLAPQSGYHQKISLSTYHPISNLRYAILYLAHSIQGNMSIFT